MLSEKGYRDRFWQGYPHLRRLLERPGDEIPRGVNLAVIFGDSEGDRTSVDHGPLGRLADLLAISRLVAAGAAPLGDAIRADASELEQVVEEVGELLGELEARIRHFRTATNEAFDREIESMRRVASEAYMAAMRRRSQKDKGHGPGHA